MCTHKLNVRTSFCRQFRDTKFQLLLFPFSDISCYPLTCCNGHPTCKRRRAKVSKKSCSPLLFMKYEEAVQATGVLIGFSQNKPKRMKIVLNVIAYKLKGNLSSWCDINHDMKKLERKRKMSARQRGRCSIDQLFFCQIRFRHQHIREICNGV